MTHREERGEGRRFVFVSGQRLGGDRGPYGAARDDAFAALVSSLVRGAQTGEVRVSLVLLGDTFDLQRRVLTSPGHGSPTARALRALGQAAAEHPLVIDGLRTAVASGVHLHVLAGDHDEDLHRPPVWRALTGRLTPASGGPKGAVRFHPWLMHVPGLLIAEHGHRHRPLSRPHHPTKPFLGADPRRRSDATPALVLAEVRHLRRAAARLPADAVRALAGTVLPASRLSAQEVDELAWALQLPGPLVVELLRVPAVLPGLLRRVERTGLGRAGGPEADRTPASVQRTVDLLADFGVTVGHYVVGHAHRASVRQVVPSGGGPVVTHLETGAWSGRTRGPRGSGARPPTYSEVTEDPDGRTSAAVRTWSE